MRGIKDAKEVAVTLNELLKFVKDLKGFIGKEVIADISEAISKLGGEN